MISFETSSDNFHRGRFVLVQPKSGAHRAGIDAMLLASCVADDFDGHVADLGAGAGAAALAVLSRNKNAKVTLFEVSGAMIECARKTLMHESNKHLKERAFLCPADITANGEERLQCGLQPNSFDWVIANPPFNNDSDRRSPHSERSFAHVMDGKTIELWSRTAASITRPSGYFSMIVRPQSIGEILAGYMGRFGALRITPVHPRKGEDAIRILVTGKKGSKQKMAITDPLFLHDKNGRNFTSAADELINGLTSLQSISSLKNHKARQPISDL